MTDDDDLATRLAVVAGELQAIRQQGVTLAQTLNQQWVLPLADELAKCVFAERWADARVAARAYVIVRWDL